MDQSLEQWRPIAGYEGLYEVSDRGRVKSLDREIISRGRIHKIKGRILVLCKDKDGYPKIKLSKNGSITMFFVHKLVAFAFLPSPPGPVGQTTGWHFNVDHINNDPSDNTISNLQWLTRLDNTYSKPKRLGRLRPVCGSRHGASKLTEVDIALIRASNEPLAKLAERYKVRKQTICKIRLRQSWKHVP